MNSRRAWPASRKNFRSTSLVPANSLRHGAFDEVYPVGTRASDPSDQPMRAPACWAEPVLVWLLGDTRLIREDAKLLLRRPNACEADEDNEGWKDAESKAPDQDLEEVDYAQVLRHINEFLPVRELIGHAIDVQTLKQFGLVDSHKVGCLPASALGKSESATGPPNSPRKNTSQTPTTPRLDPVAYSSR